MSQYLKEQAARCMQLSGACFDLDTSARLRRMAEEFRTKAAEMEKPAEVQDDTHPSERAARKRDV